MYTSKLTEHSLLATGIVSSIGLSVLIGASPASATGFTQTGDVVFSAEFEDAGLSDSLGNAEVLLSNTPGAEDNFSFSKSGAVNTTTIQSFLGLNSGSLDSYSTNYVIQGSAIKNSFTASMNNIISFSFNFLTDEDVKSSNPTFGRSGEPNPFYNDFAFLTILFDGDASAQIFQLADTFNKFQASTTSFISETGWLSYSTSLDRSGTYTVGFGIADVGDDGFSSGLLLKNIDYSARPHASVPEPLTILGSGLALGFGSLMKRQQAKKLKKTTVAK